MENDTHDAIWELAEFCAREAFILRSFLGYLRDHPDPPEKKLARIQKWRLDVGIQLGNPQVTDTATVLFQKLRAADPEERRIIVRRALADADAIYLNP